MLRFDNADVSSVIRKNLLTLFLQPFIATKNLDWKKKIHSYLLLIKTFKATTFLIDLETSSFSQSSSDISKLSCCYVFKVLRPDPKEPENVSDTRKFVVQPKIIT